MSNAFSVGESLALRLSAQYAGEALETIATEEMDRARQVQARLLRGKTPRIASLDYAGCSIPAWGVGGDFYDFLDLGPGRLGLMLGDVSGKGVSAALLMAALQASLRSHYSIGITEIPRLLRSVNRLFYEATHTHDFATLFVAQYHEATQSLVYSNCGHNPPFLFHKHGVVERLDATATVLGMFDEWDCSMKEVSLWPGDTLLLFSDGITEARDSEGVEFSESRLFDLIAAHGHLSADQLAETIAASASAFCGGMLQDDITVVAARAVTPTSALG